MAVLNNLSNSLKSTVTSSSGGSSNVGSSLDGFIGGGGKKIYNPVKPTDPGIIKPIPTTPIDPGFKPLPTDPGFKPSPTDPGVIKPIPTTPIDPGFKPLPTDPEIIKPIPTTPVDPGFKPSPSDPGIAKPAPIDPGYRPLPYERKLLNPDSDITKKISLNPAEPVEFNDALDKAQAEQIKESSSGYLNDKSGLTSNELQNKLTDENFNKLSDTEVKEKFKEQYNNASVNGLLNKTTSSFIAGGASGLVSGGDRMDVTVSEIPNIVSKLRSCESRVREIWSDLLNTYINQIENSWAGPDAQAYIEKVRGYNTKVENSAQALSLLADTYEKVMTTSQDTQQKVMNAVNNY